MNKSTELVIEECYKLMLEHLKEGKPIPGKEYFQALIDSLENIHPGFDREEIKIAAVIALIIERLSDDPDYQKIIQDTYNRYNKVN